MRLCARSPSTYSAAVSDPPTSAACVAVVGGGPGGLMAAEVLARSGVRVTVYDRMPSVGRKLLLAGRGGLNLTNDEPLDAFLDRYGSARARLADAVTAFDADALRTWADELGQQTFVGSSGRVFPRRLRATPLLRTWLHRLDELGVQRRVGTTWSGWSDDGGLRFRSGDGHDEIVRVDATVLGLGGASWPRSGSDGRWVDVVRAAGIDVASLRPANCGFDVDWDEHVASRVAGIPLKNVVLRFDGRTARGDVMLTASGLEGGPVYALSATLRDALAQGRHVQLLLDLRPDLDPAALADRLRTRRPKDSTSNHLRRAAGLSPAAVAVLRHGHGPVATEPTVLARQIAAVPLTLVAPRPIDRAISSAGGIVLDEVDETFMLRRKPGTFVVGEMLDWEAPTGGYLLQATFATAVAAAHGALAWIADPPGDLT